MDEPEKQSRRVNAPAQLSVAFALVGLVLGSVTRLGAVVGLFAVVLGIMGVLQGEKTEVGIPLSVFGIVMGLVAVLWAAASLSSQ